MEKGEFISQTIICHSNTLHRIPSPCHPQSYLFLLFYLQSTSIAEDQKLSSNREGVCKIGIFLYFFIMFIFIGGSNFCKCCGHRSYIRYDIIPRSYTFSWSSILTGFSQVCLLYPIPLHICYLFYVFYLYWILPFIS